MNVGIITSSFIDIVINKYIDTIDNKDHRTDYLFKSKEDKFREALKAMSENRDFEELRNQVIIQYINCVMGAMAAKNCAKRQRKEMRDEKTNKTTL